MSKIENNVEKSFFLKNIGSIQNSGEFKCAKTHGFENIIVAEIRL